MIYLGQSRVEMNPNLLIIKLTVGHTYHLYSIDI